MSYRLFLTLRSNSTSVVLIHSDRSFQMMLRTEAASRTLREMKRRGEFIAVRFCRRGVSDTLYPEPGSEQAGGKESGFSRLGRMQPSEIKDRPRDWYNKYESDTGYKITDQTTGDAYTQHESTESITARSTDLLSVEDRAWLRVTRKKQIHFCRGCGYGYPQQLEKCPSCDNPQVSELSSKIRTWACGECLYVNEITVRSRRGTCWNCSAPKSKALYGSFNVESSWICKPCKTIVPTVNDVCPTCTKPKLAANEFDPLPVVGSWYCSQCSVKNFKNNNKCKSCGYWK